MSATKWNSAIHRLVVNVFQLAISFNYIEQNTKLPSINPTSTLNLSSNQKNCHDFVDFQLLMHLYRLILIWLNWFYFQNFLIQCTFRIFKEISDKTLNRCYVCSQINAKQSQTIEKKIKIGKFHYLHCKIVVFRKQVNEK